MNVKFFDTTLRDGEQTPGVHLSLNQKIEIALQLEQLGIDIIEAGFPAASKGDFRAVSEISEVIKTKTVCALSRMLRDDIDAAYAALKNAAFPRIHLFIATSNIHMDAKLKMTRDEVLMRTHNMVKYAKSLLPDVQFSPEDATRSDVNFLCEVIATAISAGATTINIPDTVGYTMPSEFAALFAKIRRKVPAVVEKSITLSVHCHNDLGLATANSLAAVSEGATQIECTINGLGERAGNASFEEVVMSLETRRDIHSCTHSVNLREIMRTSRLVSSLSTLTVQPNKAIVGANAFSHESGIHQHGILCDPRTYEIINPETIGLTSGTLVLGKLSGRHAFADKIRELGYILDESGINAAFETFKETADRKKDISDSDIRAIVNEYLDTLEGKYKLDAFQIQSGDKMSAMAMISLRTPSGAIISEAAIGEGPIDAAFNAINKLTNAAASIKLETYEIRAVTEGTDALGEVKVKIHSPQATYTGRSVSTDIIKASIKAYVNAINKWDAT